MHRNPRRKIQPPYLVDNTTTALPLQAVALTENSVLAPSFEKMCSLTDQPDLLEKLRLISSLTKPIKSFTDWIPQYLGKLGAKEEPGKVRIFAMVD